MKKVDGTYDGEVIKYAIAQCNLLFPPSNRQGAWATVRDRSFSYESLQLLVTTLAANFFWADSSLLE